MSFAIKGHHLALYVSFALSLCVVTAAGCTQENANSATSNGRAEDSPKPKKNPPASTLEAGTQTPPKPGELHYAGKPLDDAAVAELPIDEQITSINLAYTQVTDEGLKQLARAPNLERVDVSGTKITDAGLEILKQLPALKHAEIHGTRVSREGHAAMVEFLAKRREVAR